MKTKAEPALLSDSEGGVQDGRVQKGKGQKKVVENAEIKKYLNKLQEMVPLMPKNKRLKKVEVISHAIDYIRELRTTLGFPPCEDSEDFEDPYQSIIGIVSDPLSIKLNVVNNEANLLHQRQPLIDISSPSNTVRSSASGDDGFLEVSKSIAAI